MADNFQADNNGNIYVEFDYNNIILVDPNRTVDSDGNISERLVDHENLIMYANLEADVIPRSKLLLGISPENSQRQTVSIAKINFLRPGKNNFFSTGYYDELTGAGSLMGQAGNQMLETQSTSSDGKAYFRSGVVDEQNVIDNGLLGITSINVKVSSSFIPSVSIELEDVQGKALFQLGNNSPYASFFNLPYPQFYLTLKGYYGQAIRYQLNLLKFNARFNSQNGNYQVTLDFQGFKFNVLNEITISHLIATPHMYSKRFNVEAKNTVSNTSAGSSQPQLEGSAKIPSQNNSPENQVATSTSYVSEKGYQKIVEVYSEYKSKGLIPPDFPELTLMQLINKFDTFQQRIVDSYPKVNVEPLTNIRNYSNILKSYFDQVIGNNTSWFSRFMTGQPIVMDNGDRVYYFKDGIFGDLIAENNAMTQLQTLLDSNNSKLRENPTLGAGRTDEIKFNLSKEKIVLENLNLNDINEFKTAQSFLNVVSPTQAQQTETIRKVEALYQKREITDSTGKKELKSPPLFIFRGQDRFVETTNQMQTETERKLQSIQAALTEDLKNRIQSTSLGIGFVPSARNIIAVIMANTEGFLRLLDDVHTNAWNVKYDPVRTATIQDTTRTSAPNIEVRKQAKITSNAANQNQGLVSAQQPVYPWPQFFVETPDDKKGRFQITYIGDPSVVDITQGYLFEKWPEVEFVEEYMKGLNQKFNVPVSQVPIESQNTTFLISFNAIEFPQKTNLPYSNKEQLKFLYEIWERQFVTARYSNFNRADSNQIQQIFNLNRDAETNNIVKALGDTSPYLIYLIKNTDFTSQNFTSYLREYSNNGTGRLWQDFIRDFFVTPYIKVETETPFSIHQTTDLGLLPQSEVGISGLTQMVINSPNDPLVIDTYPFRDYEWNFANMATSQDSQLQQVYETKKSLKVFNERNVISNFTNIYDFTTNRPVTNFSYLNVQSPNFVTQPIEASNENLKTYFNEKFSNPKLLMPTEGSVRYLSPSRALPDITTTSILNTPYFVNAIQEGVKNERNNDPYPYVTAAYLFLNSLPLASLRERYKTKDNTEDLNYIASCFNKYGAIHKVPYPWILKIGSIWYRYKTFVETNVDILSNSWVNFDYVKNFDPTSSNVSKVYSVKTEGGIDKLISLEQQTTNDIKIQTGFYPNLINDFNRFLNGTELYSSYTDTEIQTSINNGMKIYQFPNSSIQGQQGGKSLSLSTWSVLIPKNIKDSSVSVNQCLPSPNDNLADDYFIIPSFGCNLNQTKFECFAQNNPTETVVNLTSNSSMYNGSVRTFWSSSNFGYFDSNQVTKPTYQEYMNIIDPVERQQNPFKIYGTTGYTSIEEIFGVFDARALNLMEQEFLKFCTPTTEINSPITQSQIDRNNYVMGATYKNFQALMRSLMTVVPTANNNALGELFQNTVSAQFNGLNNQIKGFMEYDLIIRNGNPSKYSRRIWDSFISFNSTDVVVNPIEFDPYVVNSLPTLRGSTTLAQSQQQYPQEWQALYKEVGFSTIPKLVYTDSGSYITDFFVDNQIGFTVENITLLSQLIKIYATQKLLNPNTTPSQFRTSLNEYLNGLNNSQNIMLGLVLGAIKKELPNYEQPKEASINSQVQSMQGKVEIYEVFKALNDKWVAGSDYKTKTLFEDILFLDRASRNIGDTIILDIFDIKNMLSKNYLNEGMTVYTLISGMLMKNNFTVMPLPAYVNFYNVQEVDGVTVPNPEGSLAFANNLWGTFNNVDYRKTGPKMVCFYVGKPSSHLELPSAISGYGNDSFEFKRSPEVPLIEDQKGKTDWSLSNKCVGFNVDIGIRNQNVFTSFSVGQDNGVATSESIQSLLDMINQNNTRNVGNQDVSLYNYYKSRSYTCDVICLGNALIQPTMYFNLRHVPMFNGPYMITSVSHSIQAGSFQTSFQGVRQGVYDYPPIDNYIQAVNQNLLTQIEALVVQKTDENTTSGTTTQKTANNTQSGGPDQSPAASNSCSSNLEASYVSSYIAATSSGTTISNKAFADAILQKIPNNVQLATIIYNISYVRTFSKPGDPNGQFSSYNNNYGLISLDLSNGARDEYFDPLKYYCYNTQTLGGTKQLPMALFTSLDKYLDYMIATIRPNLPNIQEIGLLQYYVTQFPTQRMTAEEYDKDIERYRNELKPKFVAASISAAKLGLNAGVTQDVAPTPTPGTVPQTPAPTPTCPPTIVTSYSPISGKTGTIITVEGQNMQYVTNITVGGQNVDLRTVQLIGTTKIKFSVPIIPAAFPGLTLLIQMTSTNNQNVIILTPNFTYTQ